MAFGSILYLRFVPSRSSDKSSSRHSTELTLSFRSFASKLSFSHSHFCSGRYFHICLCNFSSPFVSSFPLPRLRNLSPLPLPCASFTTSSVRPILFLLLFPLPLWFSESSSSSHSPVDHFAKHFTYLSWKWENHSFYHKTEGRHDARTLNDGPASRKNE